MLTNKLLATIAEPSLPLVQKSRKSLHLWGVLMPQNAVCPVAKKEIKQPTKMAVFLTSWLETQTTDLPPEGCLRQNVPPAERILKFLLNPNPIGRSIVAIASVK